MGVHAGPDINENGLVLALDGENYKSFKGEATTNYYSTPETLTSGRTGSTDGTIKTDYTSGGPTGGRFTRVVRDTSVTRSTDWEWQIDYSNTGLSLTNPFVVSFYARCPNGTLGSIRLSNPDVEGQTFNIDSTWRRFTASFTYGAQSGLTFFRFNRGYSTFSSVNGATYDLANIQIEAKSYSTTFTTGTRGTTVATGGGWADLTGNGNNGELVNGVRESASNLGFLSFDGVDDYVDCGNTSSLSAIGGTTNITVSGWVSYTAYGGGGQPYSVITVKGNPWTWLLENPSNTFRFRITAGGSDVNVADTSTHSLNTWYNVVGTYDGSNMRVYVNGVLKNTKAQTGTLATNSVTAKIGTYQGTNYNFTGRISNISIYNRALTSEEIKQNYNALKGRFVPDGSSADKAATSAKQILEYNPTAQSGIYYIKWDGVNVYPIYCEMSLAGGGWMMILNYVHLGGTNPSLLVRNNSFPHLNSEYTLGGDESGSTSTIDGTWGHIGNALANSNNWTEYMFYGKTSFHNRIIHFTGNNTNIVNYIKTGSGSMVPHYADTSTNFNAELYNNASLPLFINSDRSGFSNQGDLAMTNFPIYGNSTIGNPRSHWGIRGLGDRWEVDDYPNAQGGSNSGSSTIHRIWVR